MTVIYSRTPGETFSYMWEGVRELGRFHCDVNRYILAALVFYVCFEDGAK